MPFTCAHKELGGSSASRNETRKVAWSSGTILAPATQRPSFRVILQMEQE